ncbi:MAG: Nif3-like dinuclear metal center hexameric protein [Pseudohongiella sp.]|nr:Nif3-like dinuclear metal center hexameric protein [Pseudohongiella sp.]MDO9520853.1 Nif3-like dinuclear metal center hexameric protein [Pseudohongiella sp.]MDP2128084.1 Nif3-like dinuclear metal center hexameric protein [Pseudohongiella sp.]
MQIELRALLVEINRLLKPDQFNDYCPNGLQIEGKSTVCHLVSGVTASQRLLDAAIAQGADAILVHHGYFWRGENQAITGLKRNRIKTLLDHDVSLLAYHLPLDAHAEFGNNVQLAHVLGLVPSGELLKQNNQVMGLLADLPEPLTGSQLNERISKALNRDAMHIDAENRLIRRVAWCTGAAQQYIEQAAQLGVDAYISGEISEPTVHSAQEHGMHYFAAGHHATERYGVKALGEFLAQRFGIRHTFIDIHNPV